jgi:hypothetical protein
MLKRWRRVPQPKLAYRAKQSPPRATARDSLIQIASTGFSRQYGATHHSQGNNPHAGRVCRSAGTVSSYAGCGFCCKHFRFLSPPKRNRYETENSPPRRQRGKLLRKNAKTARAQRGPENAFAQTVWESWLEGKKFGSPSWMRFLPRSPGKRNAEYRITQSDLVGAATRRACARANSALSVGLLGSL